MHKVAEALPRLRRGLFAVWQQEARLASRVGTDAPLVRAYARAHQLLGEADTSYRHWVDDPATHLKEWDERNELGEALTSLYREAATLVGPNRFTGPI